jgi:hypothetical protein
MKELISALIKAQAEIKNPPLDGESKGAKFSYKYSTLPKVLDAIKPVLNKYGFVIVQVLSGSESSVYAEAPKKSAALITKLFHESGQSIESSYPLKQYDDPQKEGSALTYARRYSLCAMFAIAGEEDDDAVSAKVDVEAFKKKFPEDQLFCSRGAPMGKYPGPTPPEELLLDAGKPDQFNHHGSKIDENTVMKGGKCANQSFGEILETNPSYVQWWMKKSREEELTGQMRDLVSWAESMGLKLEGE